MEAAIGIRKSHISKKAEHLQVTWVLVILSIMYIVLTFLGPERGGLWWTHEKNAGII